MVIAKVIKHASFMIIYLCIALFCIYCRDFGLHLDAHFLGIDINCHCLVRYPLFFIMYTQLYKSLCWSAGLSVGWLVGQSRS